MDLTPKQTISRINQTMRDNNITVYELAKRTGIPEPTLHRNLKGKTKMSLETFLKINKILCIFRLS